MNKISVVVICRDEEPWIRNCLKSVKPIAMEVVAVVDDRTTDKTEELCKELGAKTYVRKWDGYSKQKTFGLSKTTGDWVFFIDGDERISKELSEEIKKLDGTAGAYSIPRQNIILGQKLKHGGWWPDYITRLVKKGETKGWTGELHEVLQTNNTPQKLNGVIYHLSHRGITWMLKTSLEYTPVEAKLRLDANHPPVTWWRFFRVMFTEFFDRLILKFGWRDGTVGVIEAISQAFNIFLVYVHLWEMQKGKSMEEIYKDLDEKLGKNGF